MKFWFDKILVHRWLPEGQRGDWSVRRTVIEGSRLEWLRHGGDPYEDLLAPGTYTGLFRKLPNGSEERVMFDEPREIKEALRFVELAKGKVLLTGLGIGMVAVWLANKSEVTQVDVIEASADVINLVAPYLPSPKIRVIHADAFNYQPIGKYDSVWHDCFYTKPSRTDELRQRYPSPVQDYWQPGVLTQPTQRRSFLQGAFALAMLSLLPSRSMFRKAVSPLFSDITLVQSKTGTAAITMDSPVTAGNSLIALVATNTSSTTVSGGGASWTKDVAQSGPAPGAIELWHGHNVSGASSVVTVTPSGRGSTFTANVSEWSGLSNAAAEAVNSGTDTTTAVSTGAATNVSTNALLIAVGGWGANDYSSGPANSFSRMTNTASASDFLEGAYNIVSSVASYSTAWTLTASINWAAAIAAFGAPAPGPTPTQSQAGFFMRGNQ
jgi:hypothetical protein